MRFSSVNRLNLLMLRLEKLMSVLFVSEHQKNANAATG